MTKDEQEAETFKQIMAGLPSVQCTVHSEAQQRFQNSKPLAYDSDPQLVRATANYIGALIGLKTSPPAIPLKSSARKSSTANAVRPLLDRMSAPPEMKEQNPWNQMYHLEGNN